MSPSEAPNPIFSNVGYWKVPLLQANFAFNDLEGFTGSGPEGLSFIISAENELLMRGPHRKEGGLIVSFPNPSSPLPTRRRRQLHQRRAELRDHALFKTERH